MYNNNHVPILNCLAVNKQLKKTSKYLFLGLEDMEALNRHKGGKISEPEMFFLFF